MSSGNGKCSCGSNCSCDKGSCNCNSYDIEKPTTTVIVIDGVAPKMTFAEGAETSSEGGNECKCGSSCKCDPCNC